MNNWRGYYKGGGLGRMDCSSACVSDSFVAERFMDNECKSCICFSFTSVMYSVDSFLFSCVEFCVTSGLPNANQQRGVFLILCPKFKCYFAMFLSYMFSCLLKLLTLKAIF